MLRTLTQRFANASSLAERLAPRGWRRWPWLLRVALLPKDGRELHRLQLWHEGGPFWVHVRSFRELAPFREVFVALDYQGPWQECRTIIDLGANIGAASLYFLRAAPRSKVHAIEPDPYNYELLVKNLSEEARANVHHLALAQVDSEVVLYRRDGYNLGASITTQREGFHATKVHALGLSSFLARLEANEVDLVKFDIEGAEFGVFADPKVNRRIKAFIGEYHEDLAGRPLADFVALFPDHTVSTHLIAPARFVCRGTLRQSEKN